MNPFLIFNFKGSCPHTLETRNTFGLITGYEKCQGKKGHEGMHVDRFGNKWMTLDAQRSYIEDKARGL